MKSESIEAAPPYGSSPSPVVSRHGRRAVVAAMVGIGAIAVLVIVSLSVGSRGVPVTDVLQVLLHRDRSRASIIVWELRVPRTVLAVVVGAALGVAGVLMQAITRNPLAEPGLAGVNAGAAFFVVLAISLLGLREIGEYVWFAIGGAAMAATVVYLLGSARSTSTQHTRLVLAGIALSASLGSIIGIITMYDSDAFDSYRFWVVGSLENRSSGSTDWLAPVVVSAIVIALLLGSSLNAMALGDELGSALGLRTASVRSVSFVLVTILCATATAAAGPIVFVGLVVPHVVRLVAGVDQRINLLLCAIGGPVLLLAADIVGRVVARPAEIEVGIITAFVGAPVLLAVVLRSRRGSHVGRGAL